VSIPGSILHQLLQDLPQQKTQIYFKPALTALSHAIEDLVLAADDPNPLVIACFQRERFYRQEVQRYQRIAARTDQVYVLATPASESGFSIAHPLPITLPIGPDDALADEWHLVVLGQTYTACLICREQPKTSSDIEMARRFEGFWTFDPRVCQQAARRLIEQILDYQPELQTQIARAATRYGLGNDRDPYNSPLQPTLNPRSDLFVQRLMNYLQASQYQLLKAYNTTATLERTQRNLIAIVGHELRTPLSSIQVALESLNEEPDMPIDYRAMMLETALTESDRMRRLIQDFLTLSRLQTGQLYFQAEALRLQDMVDLALGGVRYRLAQLPQLSITVDLPPHLPHVLANGDGLVEILSKLLDNACKFTPSTGQITIQARLNNPAQESDAGAQGTARTRRDRPQVEVIVADTGRGIEPSQLPAIFNAFYQEEGFLQRSVGGTGLGLAICRCIVEGMGGQLWAVSAGKGRGSQFHFTVPIED
jgi:DICT domain-containing protein